jgi:UDP-N-acetylglucosamine--N-acetylmuramyl-(pentapeptide) pyrophosphoryl-undecaprenol N-acetylglucosamine transferase
VVPALAVAAALRAEGAEVAFIGGERAEAELVPATGYPLHTIGVEGLSRTNPLKALRSLLRAVVAVVHARALLGELRPDAVLGAGGYVAGPVGVAALTRRIPLVLSEADSHLGLTNRLLAPWARRVCLAFARPEVRRRGVSQWVGKWRGGGGAENGAGGGAGNRYLVTGRPIPAFAHDRQGARARLGIDPQETCVLIFGGSLGARSINLAAIDAFAGAALHVLHICGRRDYPELAHRQLPAGYDLREYMNLEEFSEALSAADLVVARAGGSVFEIAAHGLPAILVPYPHAAADHQSANARWMAQGGAAVVLADSQLNSVRLAHEVARLLSDPTRLASMGSAARRLARPDAAADVARELLQAAGR